MNKLREIKTFSDFLDDVAKAQFGINFSELNNRPAITCATIKGIMSEAAELYCAYRIEQAIADYEKSKWVSVDEALPDLGVKVITDSGNGQYNIASFYADQNRWVNVSGHTLSHVIKWSKIL